MGKAFMPAARRLLACGGAVAIVVVLGAQIALLLGLESFEYRPLFNLVGPAGIAVAALLNLGLACVFISLLWVARQRRLPRPRLMIGITAASAICGLWVAEWVLMERPFTVRIAGQLALAQAPMTPPADGSDLARFSIMVRTKDVADRKRLQVMFERIVINSPQLYARYPLGSTIDKYARRYGVDPTVLFFFLYVGSFWGEATSGPVPFLRSMTAETIRDVIQIRLPSWFVESSVRRELITSSWLPQRFGEHLGFKLRYAVHKATLDVSTQPYDLNLYSDVFLVLKEFEDEFPELSDEGPSDSLTGALRDSFRAIRNSALVVPYEDPYVQLPYDRSYYGTHRRHLRRFARAAFYKTLNDFEFATRVAALVLSYQQDHYRTALGAEIWEGLPDWQKAAMLGMTRDLYVPNVGRPAYNVYALPELNCTPVEFVATSADRSLELLSGKLNQVWRPRDYLALWGGAATKLRILSEVWDVSHGKPLPAMDPEDTITAARRVIDLNH